MLKIYLVSYSFTYPRKIKWKHKSGIFFDEQYYINFLKYHLTFSNNKINKYGNSQIKFFESAVKGDIH